jgi:sarcosine oxidase subunit gamma
MADARLAPARPRAQVGLRLDPGDAALLDRIGDRLGAALPVVPGAVARFAGGRVLWLGPDEWLLIHEESAANELVSILEAAVGDGFGTVVDLSANRVVLAVEGADAGAVLATAVSIDLHPRAFPDGRVVQTLLARAQVILEHDGDRFLVYVRPSFAAYVEAWLRDAIEGLSLSREQGCARLARQSDPSPQGGH